MSPSARAKLPHACCCTLTDCSRVACISRGVEALAFTHRLRVSGELSAFRCTIPALESPKRYRALELHKVRVLAQLADPGK